MDSVKITIIGSGVIGLSIAAELSKYHADILLVERHGKQGQETSSRSSEVIHSGIYYKNNSLKAKLCVEGAALLYEYCEKNSVAHLKTGKLIVAVTKEEREDLESLFKHGTDENGVKNLRLIDAAEAAKIDPCIKAAAAIHSPDTGIVDSHSLMSRLSTEAAAKGVVFSFNTEINFIEKKTPGGYILGVKDSDYRFFSHIVINASGLSSDRVASMAGIDVDEAGYRLSYCKGSYFTYSGTPPPCRMLVYPLPERQLKGLGIHATVDMAGRLRFGPDTEDVDEIDYRVDAGKGQMFFESASKYIKNLKRDALAADMAGVRPKLKGGDFIITHEHLRGLEGFINLIGIESPGLTACISIARMVSAMVRDV
ncbi:MAG: NAD(P)/FAD-dependent oxidoreductase [Nitrospirae bacterium]|nr:NAD(P)/FAD-dependent oxidoreductase [Nitrospirota bacterium]MBF0535792.1 NAD(P)/FAD-dependent oxidoreductase [Nitrospirota bacterium]MBF0617667.1 NAD(P)/FAD-dependent oxidoreductase [Nitrospirota bacterium]